MNVNGRHFRTIWPDEKNRNVIKIIDQRHLPHRFVIEELPQVEDFIVAIRDMHVRGAGLIGATAGFGMFSAALEAPADKALAFFEEAACRLLATRPTARNLAWAVERQLAVIRETVAKGGDIPKAIQRNTFAAACAIADDDADFCRRIGEHGLKIIEKLSRAKHGEPVNILTHCNAGWLAFVDYGSATAPIYAAHRAGIKVHVWVDETRPWNQGAKLTAWELGQEGVEHTLIADNTGGHLMQHSQVDLVLVGTDRTTRNGDVANKIGTYLKALAAHDNRIPFYVGLPSPTIDWTLTDGLKGIPIEERDPSEVSEVGGINARGEEELVRITPAGATARNFAFDVTPARLVTGLITERGVCAASEQGLLSLFPEQRALCE